MKWFLAAAGVCERVPLLIADVEVWKQWNGREEAEDAFDALEGVVGAVDVDGRVIVPFSYDGGVFDIGIGKGEVVVAQHYAADDDRDAHEPLRKALADREHDEYLAGTIQVSKGVLIGDSWERGSALDLRKVGPKANAVTDRVFFAPLASGTYLVLEGRTNDEDSHWYRLRKPSATSYAARQEARSDSSADEVATVMKRISFSDGRQEARALEDARLLVKLGRPDLALEICDKASPGRRVLATWTRLFALSASNLETVEPLTALVEEWLRPAVSATSANQVLTRQSVLAVIDVAMRGHEDQLTDLRRRVSSSPEPEIFVSNDDSF